MKDQNESQIGKSSDGAAVVKWNTLKVKMVAQALKIVPGVSLSAE
jgi:hypothetical protein